jgi:hypothetical protein
MARSYCPNADGFAMSNTSTDIFFIKMYVDLGLHLLNFLIILFRLVIIYFV